MVKMGSLCICENSTNDKSGKPILIGLLGDIKLLGTPSTYSFSIVTTLLYLEKGKSYSMEIILEDEQVKVKPILDKKIDNIRLPDNSKKDIDNIIVTFNVQNQPFFNVGTCTLTTKISEMGHSEIIDSATLEIPIQLLKAEG